VQPTATPDPLTVAGYFRSYYYTRQNASNNPGTQFDFQPGAKYNSNAVNQATLDNAIDLGAKYALPGGFKIGATYFYANPLDGPCSVADNHAKGAVCVTQVPPNTNPDDGMPGFALSTLLEAYVGYTGGGFSAVVGNQLFSSPWANPSDSFIKPASFQGADVKYTGLPGWTFEAAEMNAFENRTSSQFTQQTLLTGYPAGSPGLPPNIYVPGGHGLDSGGMTYGKLGYQDGSQRLSVDAYFYAANQIANMWWFDGRYALGKSKRSPYFALQGGFENNQAAAQVGTISSSVFGAQIGESLSDNVTLSLGYDGIPWHTATVALRSGVSCNDDNYQISAKGATLPYFLPLNAGQCYTNATTGLTSLYYGGWASPYTDSYGTDPLFTTSVSQGMAVRRSPGTSWQFSGTYTSNNKRVVFTASDAWYDFGNALVAQATNSLVLDGTYRFSVVSKAGPYKGLQFRYRYVQRTQSNTFCGAWATSCSPSEAPGTSYLGGLPLFKYNRAMLEYDF
jgi:hypothetical protein